MTTPDNVDYPAHGTADNPIRAAHGTRLLIQGLRWGRATLGTAAGYAAEYGQDPNAGVASAIQRGHETVWANADAGVLSNTREPEPVRLKIKVGDHLRVEGRTFKVCAPHMAGGDGDNPRLVDVTPKDIAATLSPAVTVTVERGPRHLQVTGRWPANP